MYLDANGEPGRGPKRRWLPRGRRAGDRAWGSRRTQGIRHDAAASADRAGDRLARDGFMLDARRHRRARRGDRANFARQPNVAAMFFNHGQPLQARRALVQTQLGATLRAIGATAASMRSTGAPSPARSSRRAGATAASSPTEDFAAYTVAETAADPLLAIAAMQVLSAPPPSSGGVTLCEMLQILEGLSAARDTAFTRRLERACHDGSDAPRLSRPQLLPRRSRPSSTIPSSGCCRPRTCREIRARIASGPGDAVRDAAAGLPRPHRTPRHDALFGGGPRGQRGIGDLYDEQ